MYKLHPLPCSRVKCSEKLLRYCLDGKKLHEFSSCCTAALILSERLLECNRDNFLLTLADLLVEKNVLFESMSKSRFYQLMRKCDMLL